MTPNVAHLLDQVPYNGLEQVQLGNGNDLPIKHVDSSILNHFLLHILLNCKNYYMFLISLRIY